MRGIPGKKDSASPVGIDQASIVGPSPPALDRFYMHVVSADAPQDGFDFLARDRRLTILRRTAEVAHDQSAREWSIGEHATRCVIPAGRQRTFRLVDFDDGLVHRHCWRRPGKIETSHLADG